MNKYSGFHIWIQYAVGEGPKIILLDEDSLSSIWACTAIDGLLGFLGWRCRWAVPLFYHIIGTMLIDFWRFEINQIESIPKTSASLSPEVECDHNVSRLTLEDLIFLMATSALISAPYVAGIINLGKFECFILRVPSGIMALNFHGSVPLLNLRHVCPNHSNAWKILNASSPPKRVDG